MTMEMRAFVVADTMQIARSVADDLGLKRWTYLTCVDQVRGATNSNRLIVRTMHGLTGTKMQAVEYATRVCGMERE